MEKVGEPVSLIYHYLKLLELPLAGLTLPVASQKECLTIPRWESGFITISGFFSNEQLLQARLLTQLS